MGDVNQCFCPFPGGLAFQIRGAVFGDNVMSGHTRRSDNGTRLQHRSDEGFHSAVGQCPCRRSTNETFAAFRLEGTHYEVQLSAGAGNLLVPYGFGTYLPVQVDLNAAVYRYEILNAGNDVYVVYIVYRRVAADRVVVDEVVEPLRAAGKGIESLAFVYVFVPRELACLEEIHVGVNEHLCVRIDVADV